MTTNSNFTVCSVVKNDNISGLFDLMIRSVLKYTDENVKFIICDNGNNKLDRYTADDRFLIINNSSSRSSGSLQHGESLNKIFSLVDTDKFAIVESDCVILNNEWNKIDYSKYKFMAAPKDHGSRPGRTMYHACFMAGSANLLRHNGIFDFRPGKDGGGLNKSYKPHEDVCWRLHDKISIGGQIKQLQFVDTKGGKGKYFNSSFQSDEFWKDGVPIVSHFGRGSNIPGKAIRDGFDHPRKQLDMWKDIVNKILDK